MFVGFSVSSLRSVVGVGDVHSAVGSGSVGFLDTSPASFVHLPTVFFLFPFLFLCLLLLFVLLCLLFLLLSVWCFFCSCHFPRFLFPLSLILLLRSPLFLLRCLMHFAPFLLFPCRLSLLFHLPFFFVCHSCRLLACQLRPSLHSCCLFWHVGSGCCFAFSFVCLFSCPLFSVSAYLLSLAPTVFSLGYSSPASSSVVPAVTLPPLALSASFVLSKCLQFLIPRLMFFLRLCWGGGDLNLNDVEFSRQLGCLFFSPIRYRSGTATFFFNDRHGSPALRESGLSPAFMRSSLS